MMTDGSVSLADPGDYDCIVCGKQDCVCATMTWDKITLAGVMCPPAVTLELNDTGYRKACALAWKGRQA